MRHLWVKLYSVSFFFFYFKSCNTYIRVLAINSKLSGNALMVSPCEHPTWEPWLIYFNRVVMRKSNMGKVSTAYSRISDGNTSLPYFCASNWRTVANAKMGAFPPKPKSGNIRRTLHHEQSKGTWRLLLLISEVMFLELIIGVDFAITFSSSDSSSDESWVSEKPKSGQDFVLPLRKR